MKVEYKKNEWLVVYVDENGDRQILPFDTFELADTFTRRCMKENALNLIGIMTTRFFDHYIEKVIDN